MKRSCLYYPDEPDTSPAVCLEGTIATHLQDFTVKEGQPWHDIRLTERPGDCFLYYEGERPVHAPRVNVFGEMPPGTRVLLHAFDGFTPYSEFESRDNEGNLHHLIHGIEVLGSDGLTVVRRTRNDVSCVFGRG